MRQGRQHRAKRFFSTVVASLVACAVGMPATAVTRYNPSVSFGYARTSDVTFFAGGSSDDSWNAVVTLPWIRQGGHSQTRLNYVGRFTSYQTFSNLDNLSHEATAAFSRELTPRTTFDLSARIARTQDQGNPFKADAGNLFLARRTTRTLGGFGVGLTQEVKRLWRIDVGVDASWARFEEIEDFEAGDDVPDVEDGRAYEFRTIVTRATSKRNSFGGSYRFGIIEKESSPDEQAHVIALNYGREVREKGSFGLSVGGYQRSRIDLQDDADYRDSGAYLTVGLGFGEDLGPFQFRFRLEGGPTMGDGLSGTSTNYYAGVTVTQAEYRSSGKWRWSFAARYAYRQPSDRTLSDTTNLSMRGFVDRKLSRQLSASASFRFVEQRQKGDELATRGSYSEVGVGLVWNPLAGSRLASGR